MSEGPEHISIPWLERKVMDALDSTEAMTEETYKLLVRLVDAVNENSRRIVQLIDAVNAQTEHYNKLLTGLKVAFQGTGVKFVNDPAPAPSSGEPEPPKPHSPRKPPR